MFGIGMTETIIILGIALLIFGPGKIPEIGNALGKGIRNFKSGVKGDDEDSKKVLPAIPGPGAHESEEEKPK